MFITGARGFRRPPKRKEMPKIAGRVISFGCPYTIMNTMCTVYIVALNVILAGFGDAAVTVLGLYYKMQAFFFIPLLSLSTCIIPVLSYNYARGSYRRCRAVMRDSVILSLAFMLVGVFCFEVLPSQVISIFSREAEVFAVGSAFSRRCFPLSRRYFSRQSVRQRSAWQSLLCGKSSA